MLSIFLFKLLLIWITGLLFNLRNETNAHIYEYILLSQVFSSLLFISIVIHGFYPQAFDRQLIMNFMSYGMLGVSILVAFKVNAIISFKNVFIISYFCITEFIPALIMFRLF
jgi:hypothetical protein